MEAVSSAGQANWTCMFFSSAFAPQSAIGRFQHAPQRSGGEHVLGFFPLLLHAGQGQQVFEDGVQPLGLLGDDFEELLPLLGVVHRPVQQRFDIALDGSDGRFQFVGDIGHEIAADALQPFQVGNVVDHQQGAAAAFGSVAEHGAVDVQESRFAVAEHDLAFDRLLRGNHGGHELVEIDAADDLRQRAAFRPGGVHAQEAGRGIVHAEQALVGVDGQDAFHHAGEDGVALVPLPHDRVELVFQVGGHLVERFGQAADFLGIGGREAMAQVAAGEPFGVVAEFLEGFDEAAGDDQAGDGRAARPSARLTVRMWTANLPQGGVDRRQGNGRPHHAQRLIVVAGRTAT